MSVDVSTKVDALAITSSPGAWVRAIGYHESVAGELDRWRLDTLTEPGVPVRVQHRSGKLWMLNSAAVAAAGLESIYEPGVERDADGRATGRVWRRDDLLASVSQPPDLTYIATRALELGVTALTDATPGGSPSDLATDLRAAGVQQRLTLMGPLGAATRAPVKVLLDDDRLPTIDVLADTVRAARAEGRHVAFHCVTRLQLVVALAALEACGPTAPGDRIEHGSLIDADLVGTLAKLGVTVVTQPHFIAERGDEYLIDVERDDRGALYRCRSLIDAGIRVLAGTDAPFGKFDPWASIHAAMERRTRLGAVIGASERVDVDTAVRLYTGSRRIKVGLPADLCLLHIPWRALRTTLPDAPVAMTVCSA